MKLTITLKFFTILLVCLSSLIQTKAQVPGSFDQSFHCYSGFDDEVLTIATDLTGKKIIGGYFNNYDNHLVTRMIGLNPDNSIDESFFNGFAIADVYRVTTITPSNDGGYFVGGTFTKYEGVSVGSIMKIDANGHIDSTFNDTGVGFSYNTDYAPTKITQLPDDKILICGIYNLYNGAVVKKIFRLMPDGTVDATFSTNLLTTTEINDFEILPDNSIIVAGDFSYTYGGVTKLDIAKLGSNGIVDTTFHLAGTGVGTGIPYYLTSVEIMPDEKILIGGYFNNINGTTKYGLCRLNANGTLDGSFLASPTSGTYVYDLHLHDDKIYVGGSNLNIGGYTGDLLALNSDGSAYTAFPAYNSNGEVYVINSNSVGSLFIGGNFEEFGNRVENQFIQLNLDGTIDEPANGLDAANTTVYSIADNLDGQSYVVGNFTLYDKYAINRIVKLKANGAVDTSFHSGTGFNDDVRQIVRQNNGRLIVAGDFTTYNGTTKNHVARLYPDGTLDPLFSVGAGPSSYTSSSIKDIEFMSDGKVIVAGTFATFSGITKVNIVKLFTNGTVDLAFNPASISGINCIEIQSDNKIIVGGSFTTVNGITKRGLARLNVNGTLDPTFNTGAGGSTIYDCDRTPDGKIIVVGSFTTYDGVAVNRIARLFANGSIDTTFHPGTGTLSTIDFVKVLGDGRILISGSFGTFNGTDVGDLAVLSSDGSLDNTFNAGMGSGLTGDPYATVVQTDGNILIGSSSNDFDTFLFNRVCRIAGPGCESIYDTVFATILFGESYLLPDGSTVSVSGTYITTTDYIFDCDYITTTILTVLPLPCNTPGGISVTNITTNSAKINWTAVPGATQYNVWYRKTGVVTWTKKNATTTFKTLTGLLAASTYEYKIRSKCDAEYSAFSAIATFTTLPLKAEHVGIESEPTIYPNPNDGQFILHVPDSMHPFFITIRNVSGSVVYQSNSISNDAYLPIELQHPAAGIYHVFIEANQTIYSLNLVIR